MEQPVLRLSPVALSAQLPLQLCSPVVSPKAQHPHPVSRVGACLW